MALNRSPDIERKLAAIRCVTEVRIMSSLPLPDRTRSALISAALLALALMPCAGTAKDRQATGETRLSGPRSETQEQPRMEMTVGTQRFAVRLDDNPTARAFAQSLPATFDMAELNGNEKFARLPRSLPSNATRPGTLHAGDVMLYGNDTLVVFYETFRSGYSYTRIGRIEEPAGLAQALGPGDARVTFTAP
jgi:hypothetical protein